MHRSVSVTDEDDFDLSLEWEQPDGPSRPLRFLPPGRCVVEVTTRTIQGLLLLKPTPEANARIRAVLGRASALYPAVKILGYWFLSNHWEALLEVPNAQVLSDFMSHVNSNLARQLGELFGWEGPFWARRYRAIVIVDNVAQVRRLKYLLSQGTKENLVARPADWPGVSSLRATLEGVNDVGAWFDSKKEYQSRKQRRKRGQQPRPRRDFVTPYEIPVHPLPCWSRLSTEEQRRRAAALVQEIESTATERRKKTGKRPFGVRKILSQPAKSRPPKVARSPAPLVHASTRLGAIRFVARYKRFLRRYREASDRLLAGDAAAIRDFPSRCFLPRPPGGATWRATAVAA